MILIARAGSDDIFQMQLVMELLPCMTKTKPLLNKKPGYG
jgi:hypothetical protein